MDQALVGLKLVLDAVDVGADIGTLPARKTVQKAIYLSQRAGVDLGYRFGWYLLGPYSQDLARDYYALDIQNDEAKALNQSLSERAQERLRSVAPLMQVPAGVPLERPEWLELLASVDFLSEVAKEPTSEAQTIIRREKPGLYPYISHAKAALEEAGLSSRAV